MLQLLPFIIAGITTGSVYGLAGIGLVLTYKTSGIFNFAYGSLATVSAFIFYTLNTEHNVAWPVAFVLAVLVAGPLMGLMLERFGRALAGVALPVQVVGTLGLLLIVEAGVLLIYGGVTTRTVGTYLPQSGFAVGGSTVSVADLIILAATLASAVILFAYFRLARTGAAMRAVVDDSDLLGLAGTNPTAVRRWAWIIGSTFAALSGVLLAPLLPQLDGTSLTLLVVTAFGAAAVGSFTSLPLTYIGGIAIGIAGSLATKYFTSGFWSNIPPALPFIVLLIVLLVTPKSRLALGSVTTTRPKSPWRAPGKVQIGGGVLVLAVLILAPGIRRLPSSRLDHVRSQYHSVSLVGTVGAHLGPSISVPGELLRR